jgi:hypothetical protein
MEQKKKYTLEMAMRFRMLLAFANMLEAELVDFESSAKRAGYAIIHEQKQAFNKLKHLVIKLRSMDQHLDAEAQEGLGISSDFFRLFCWRLSLNCKDDQLRWQQSYNGLKAMFPALIDFDLTKDEKILYDNYDIKENVSYEVHN